MALITAESSTGLTLMDRAPLAVQEFVLRKGLSSDLGEAVSVASQVFDVAGPVSLSVEEDPDISESWIEINVSARGSVDEVMKAHERYTERLLSLPATSARQIRLFLHIARD